MSAVPTIRLSTAKKVLRYVREQGFSIVHKDSMRLKILRADGAVSGWSPRKIRVSHGASFATFMHELGHALDFQHHRWQRVGQVITRHTYAAEIAANREATSLLWEIGDEADVAAFRADMVSFQIAHRNRRRGFFTRSVDLRNRIKTRYLIARHGGKPRFMLVMEVPVRLRRSARSGTYAAPDGTRIVLEWSGDGSTWKRGMFIPAASPESRRSDGTWVYRAVSSIPHNGSTQLARVAVTA